MKIIDETGAVVENPDLTLGYLTDDTQPLEHPAQEAVAEVAHYETVAEYPGGGKDVQRVVDVPGVPARPAWTEQLPIKRYVRYTAEELAAQEEERKKQEAKDKLPETVADLMQQLYQRTVHEKRVGAVPAGKFPHPEAAAQQGIAVLPAGIGVKHGHPPAAGLPPRPAAGRGHRPAF